MKNYQVWLKVKANGGYCFFKEKGKNNGDRCYFCFVKKCTKYNDGTRCVIVDADGLQKLKDNEEVKIHSIKEI